MTNACEHGIISPKFGWVFFTGLHQLEYDTINETLRNKGPKMVGPAYNTTVWKHGIRGWNKTRGLISVEIRPNLG